MSEGVELKVMSYAKIVNPAAEALQEKPEAPEIAEVAQEAAGEAPDDEGFQEVTNKKAEKAKEKPKRKRKVGPRKVKEFKEGSVEQEQGETQGSKEVTPEKEEEEKEEIEYVPAPPPKNNPWKKPAAKAATAAPAVVEGERVTVKEEAKDKAEKKAARVVKVISDEKLVKPSTQEAKVILSSKSNPWKKVDHKDAKEKEEVAESPAVIASEIKKKVVGGTTWPTLAEQPVKKASLTRKKNSRSASLSFQPLQCQTPLKKRAY